ncbi:MAG TPA: zinc ribbon domain-containing protein [Candidatus Eremiobacteraeota bacterium]|nr:MAG: Double zinc ribbon [bacterium ADurb.Bin363]HPZ10023.1 zinc ribbon domain-containing protein [Candidatus Eremiobacteraeota bacterium]
MANCPHCNGDVSENAKFCAFCGKNIPQISSNNCPSCGATLLSGKKYCHKCGAESGGKDERRSLTEGERAGNKFLIPVIVVGIMFVAGIMLCLVGIFSFKDRLFQRQNNPTPIDHSSNFTPPLPTSEAINTIPTSEPVNNNPTPFPTAESVNNNVTPETGVYINLTPVDELPKITPTISPNIIKSIKSSPVDILKQNYAAINNREFEEAYNLRSKSYRSKTSYEEYYDIWKTNITISLKETEILEQSDQRAKIRIKLYSEDKDKNSEQTDKALYSGVIYLINEDGNWRIDRVDITSRVILKKMYQSQG